MKPAEWYWQSYGWFVVMGVRTSWAVVDDFGALVLVGRLPEWWSA